MPFARLGRGAGGCYAPAMTTEPRTDTPSSAPDRPVLAFILVASGLALLCSNDAMIKDLSLRYPTSQILAMRFAFGLPFALAVYAFSGRPAITGQHLRQHAVRSVFLVLTAAFFFLALALLPLAEAVALTFLSPLFVAMLASLTLREQVPVRVWSALALGLGGVVAVASGSLTIATGGVWAMVGLICALTSALTYAVFLVQLRHRAQQDSAGLILLLQHIFPLLFVAPVALYQFRMPQGSDLWLFAALGLVGAFSQWLYTLGYARAKASRLALVEYSALLWSALLGYAFFGEWPGPLAWAGIGLIVMACLWGNSGTAKD